MTSSPKMPNLNHNPLPQAQDMNTKSSLRMTYLPTQPKFHPPTPVLHPLIFTEAGTQTDVHISNGVSCRTTAKLMLGVVLSAIGVVVVIFVMKCKFKIGFQMNMCYYM